MGKMGIFSPSSLFYLSAKLLSFLAQADFFTAGLDLDHFFFATDLL